MSFAKSLINWSGKRDLNPPPSPWQGFSYLQNIQGYTCNPMNNQHLAHLVLDGFVSF